MKWISKETLFFENFFLNQKANVAGMPNILLVFILTGKIFLKSLSMIFLVPIPSHPQQKS